jgi:hypothetical protein
MTPAAEHVRKLMREDKQPLCATQPSSVAVQEHPTVVQGEAEQVLAEVAFYDLYAEAGGHQRDVEPAGAAGARGSDDVIDLAKQRRAERVPSRRGHAYVVPGSSA